MQYLKIVVLALALTFLAWSDAGAAGEKNCCLKAIAENRECTNKCCIKAHQEGRSCLRCNPNREDAKLIKKAPAKDQHKAPNKK